MEILVWLLLLPLVVVAKAIIVGAPKLAELTADAEHAISTAEDKYKSRLEALNAGTNP
jgi:hypothetical protein